MVKVSYSQYSTWRSCQHKWKLIYKDDASSFNENINLLFGTAMHHTLQSYINVMYSDTINAADDMDLNDILYNKMRDLYLESKSEENFSEFTNKEEMAEFYNDGVQILNFFKKNKSDYFSKKYYSLVGIEFPLEFKITDFITFTGYLDVVLKDNISGDIYIYDFKTSMYGWRDKAKKDDAKTSQLLLYKNYYSKLYDIPLEKIHVKFIILKRKLYENIEYYQKRVQEFEPANGKPSVGKSVDSFNNFINDCYTETGEFIEKKYNKNVSKSICKYCEFNNRPDLCDKLG